MLNLLDLVAEIIQDLCILSESLKMRSDFDQKVGILADIPGNLDYLLAGCLGLIDCNLLGRIADTVKERIHILCQLMDVIPVKRGNIGIKHLIDNLVGDVVALGLAFLNAMGEESALIGCNSKTPRKR